MAGYQEIPRPQSSRFEIDRTFVEVYTCMLQKLLRNIPVDSTKVRTVIDLFCGKGIFTAGSLGTFPNATIHAVDYHQNSLSQILQNEKRIVFHQGWVVEMLQTTNIPPADFVTISYAGRLHGFHEHNIDALTHHVGGFLLTLGDNGGLENMPCFRNRFTMTDANYQQDAYIWLRR